MHQAEECEGRTQRDLMAVWLMNGEYNFLKVTLLLYFKYCTACSFAVSFCNSKHICNDNNYYYSAMSIHCHSDTLCFELNASCLSNIFKYLLYVFAIQKINIMIIINIFKYLLSFPNNRALKLGKYDLFRNIWQCWKNLVKRYLFGECLLYKRTVW